MIVNIIEILPKLGLVKSKSQARRLLKQRALAIIPEDSNTTRDAQVITTEMIDIKEGMVIKYGKRKFTKVTK
jgi:tyrosyl-tRNA synthetase